MVDIIFAIGIGAVLIFALLCLYALLKAKNRGEQLARAAAINRQQQHPMRIVALQNMGYTCDPLHDPILDELSFSSIYPDNACPPGLSRLEVPPPTYDEVMRLALSNSLQDGPPPPNSETREPQNNAQDPPRTPTSAPPPYNASATSTVFTFEEQNNHTIVTRY